MTPAVSEKFKEAKALYEKGSVELLPLLRAIQGNESITANSTEYKQLVKAIDSIKNGSKTTNKNEDGFVGGQEVSEKDYFLHLAKQRQKK